MIMESTLLIMEKSWNFVFEFLWEPCYNQSLEPAVFLTVNLEIFVRILFSGIALKDIFATLEIRNLGMIYVYQ